MSFALHCASGLVGIDKLTFFAPSGFNQATVHTFDGEGRVRTELAEVDENGTLMLTAAATEQLNQSAQTNTCCYETARVQ